MGWGEVRKSSQVRLDPGYQSAVAHSWRLEMQHRSRSPNQQHHSSWASRAACPWMLVNYVNIRDWSDGIGLLLS